jgi:phosphate butyryltransferase
VELSNFEALVAKVKGEPKLRRVALVEAHDEHALEAVLAARADGLVEPVLIGRRDLIEAALAKLAPRATLVKAPEIIETENEAASAAAGCRLVREGGADFLMKGKLQTAELLRAVVDRETGLRTGSVMSHLAFFGLPGRDKFIVATDGGMLLYPDLAQKKQIIENAVGALRALGYANPKVAVLAAVETVNEKMPETLDAAELKRMNLAGEIAGCTVEGPISYDLAVNAESAGVKGYSSPVAGEADIFVVPNITAGNILGKCLVYSAKARMAGIVAGASVPIVLTSRGASAEEKYLSLALAAAVSS